MDFKRFVAVKAWIADLHESEYKRDNGNVVEFKDDTRAGRVNLIGLVVGIDDSVWIDDSTGTIAVRSFDAADVSIGDCVVVIGRPREFESQKYVLGEIIKRVDKKWFDVRKKLVKRVVPLQKVETPSDNNVDVINIVRELDVGEGADYEEVVSRIGGEDKIVHLLAVGELFETKPGRLKVLE